MTGTPGPLVLPPDEFETVQKVAAMLGMDRPAPSLGERSGDATGAGEAAWRERAEAAEAKLAKIEVHLPVVLDALRIAVASGGYEYDRKRYQAALEDLGGSEGQPNDD